MLLLLLLLLLPATYPLALRFELARELGHFEDALRLLQTRRVGRVRLRDALFSSEPARGCGRTRGVLATGPNLAAHGAEVR